MLMFVHMHNFKRMAGRADRLLARLCLSRPDAVARLARPRWVDDLLPVLVQPLVLVLEVLGVLEVVCVPTAPLHGST